MRDFGAMTPFASWKRAKRFWDEPSNRSGPAERRKQSSKRGDWRHLTVIPVIPQSSFDPEKNGGKIFQDRTRIDPYFHALGLGRQMIIDGVAKLSIADLWRLWLSGDSVA
jgi:hypothetical protein